MEEKRNWKSLLNVDADPTAWLLEDDNPSVRYFTLVDILDKSESDTEVKKAKSRIMETGIVPAILAKQNEDGSWGSPARFYIEKYKGTVWQLLILAELGADGYDERIRKACEFILKYSQDTDSGGFSMNTSAKACGGRHSEVIPCLTGNMVWSLIRLGYLDDSRVKRGIDWIARYQRYDDNDNDNDNSNGNGNDDSDGATGGIHTGWPYDKATACWGRHSCHMGVVKALKAMAEIPAIERSEQVRKSIGLGVEYILAHHIHKKSHDLGSISKPGWLRLGFPLMYQTDILEILGILLKLDVNDERMREAFDIVISKQDTDGRWKLENTYNGRFQVNIEKKGKPSKWITLNALRVLRNFR